MSAFDAMEGWVDSRLEAYVDGELPPDERRRVEAYLSEHADAAEQLRLAETVSRELSAMERPACPPEIASAVIAQARREVRGSLLEEHAAALRSRLETAWTYFLRPSLAVGLLAAVVVAGALVGRKAPEQAPVAAHAGDAAVSARGDEAVSGDAAVPEEISHEEVRKALREAKWALALVSEAGREAGQSIRRSVLDEGVAQPVRRALGSALTAEPNS